MAQQTEKETVTTEYERVISTTCDLCGAKADKTNWVGEWVGSVISNTSVNARMYTTVRLEEIFDGENGAGTEITYDYDVCPECWQRIIGGLFLNKPRVTTDTWE